MPSVVSVCVCLYVSPLRAVSFESPDLETSFWYADTPSEYRGQVRMSRSSVKVKVTRAKNLVCFILFAAGLPSTERHSCTLLFRYLIYFIL